MALAPSVPVIRKDGGLGLRVQSFKVQHFGFRRYVLLTTAAPSNNNWNKPRGVPLSNVEVDAFRKQWFRA